MSQYDYLGKQALNAIFGDAIVAERYPEIALSWQYGQNVYDMTESVTGTGAVSYATSNATVSTGASTGTARLESDKALRYKPGFDGYAYFTTLFTTPEADTYQRAGLFTADNGYFVGYEGTQLQLTIRAGGSDTAVPFGTSDIDLTKLHIWRISYGYLGAAPILLERYTGLGGWKKMAVYDQVGALASPTVLNPSLPWALEVGRTSGSGAITLSSASASAGRIGSLDAPVQERQFAAQSAKTSLTTTHAILTIRNKSTFASVANKVPVQLDYISAGLNTNKVGRVEFWKNAALGGSPSYTDVDANSSVVDYDVAGTTRTNGQFVGGFALGSSDNSIIQFPPNKLVLLPGETLTITGVTTGTTPDFDVIAAWSELF